MNVASNYSARQLIMILAVLIIIKWNLTFCPSALLWEGLQAVDTESSDKGFDGELELSVGGWWYFYIKSHVNLFLIKKKARKLKVLDWSTDFCLEYLTFSQSLPPFSLFSTFFGCFSTKLSPGPDQRLRPLLLVWHCLHLECCSVGGD